MADSPRRGLGRRSGHRTAQRAARRWTDRTISNGAVEIAVRESGDGPRTVVLLPGLGARQQVWDTMAAHLGPEFRLITCDLRGHGRSSDAARYTLSSMVGDLRAVIGELCPTPPIVVGWSLGAEIALGYADVSPKTLAGVLAVDGAIPVTEQMADETLRKKLSAPHIIALRWAMARIGAGDRLSPDQLFSLLQEVEVRRLAILEVYARLDLPIQVVLGSKTDRQLKAPSSPWRDAGDRLAAAQPGIPLTWVDSDHHIPAHRPRELAILLSELAARAYPDS